MQPIEEGYYYHIYNRGADRNNSFWDSEDFREFIKKYVYYLHPCIQTYSWCLLNNHFHSLIRVRTQKEQHSFYNSNKEFFQTDKYHGKKDPKTKPFSASRQISHLMNSYTRFINKKSNRSGTLIEGPLKRKKIIDESNFLHLICYIHRNPIHHGLVNDYKEYKYSSYSDFISNRNSFLETNEVLESFGGKENFIRAHEEFRQKTDSDDDIYLE
jgi:putative transposase